MNPRTLLAPLTPLYRLGLDWRERRLRTGREQVRRLRFPVISIGNLSTGGAGKTPLTITLARALTARGVAVDVLSRGYGRSGTAPARVRLDGNADEFGDEPLLIARSSGVPVFVGRQRYEAGMLAEAEAAIGRRVHLLDDGYQHRQLHRDVNILLLNREDWYDRLLPAGNLRETLHAAVRADVIAVRADDPGFEAEIRTWAERAGWSEPVWKLRRHMDMPAITGPVVAFCGIARPEQFFLGIEAAGLPLAGRIALPDHHRYSEGDLRRIDEEAREAGAQMLLTTEKDLVRLPAFGWSVPLEIVRLRTEIEDESAALDWVLGRIAPAPQATPSAGF